MYNIAVSGVTIVALCKLTDVRRIFSIVSFLHIIKIINRDADLCQPKCVPFNPCASFKISMKTHPIVHSFHCFILPLFDNCIVNNALIKKKRLGALLELPLPGQTISVSSLL